ncbi:MAG: PLP-dependent aminotransferase family protein [Enterococcus sp.]
MWQKVQRSKKPAYIQIVEQISQAIDSQRLLTGDRLQSERQLAVQFGVNRSTVVHALDELRDLGRITSRQGSGRFVSPTTWGEFSVPRVDFRRLASKNYIKEKDRFGEKISEMKHENRQIVDFYSSELPVDLLPCFSFPDIRWKDIWEKEQAQEEYGYLPLRKEIAHLLIEQTKTRFSEDEVLITAGSQHAIFLILQTLLSQGDAVAVESPSFFYKSSLFQAAGVRLYGVEMDDEGIDLYALEQLILRQKIKLVMVNPNFQNPTGMVMSQRRRHALIDLCRKYHLPIIEDAVFADLSFVANERTTSLKELDPENVLYVGSLSAVLGKTTKVGWIMASPTVLSRFSETQQMMGFSINILTQLSAMWVLKDSFDKHMAALLEKLQLCKFYLKQWEEEQTFFSIKPIQGGYYAWISWEGKPLDEKAALEILESGFACAPAFLFGSEKTGLRINYSRLTKQNYQQFVQGMDCLKQKVCEK